MKKKKTELIFEKLLRKLFNAGLSKDNKDGTMKTKNVDSKKDLELMDEEEEDGNCFEEATMELSNANGVLIIEQGR